MHIIIVRKIIKDKTIKGDANMQPKVNKDLVILTKGEFYKLPRQERVRRITLWRSNYPTKQIIEAMGFNSNQAFYGMLSRLGLPTSWNEHREMWKQGKLDMGKDTLEEFQESIQEINQLAEEIEEVQVMPNNTEVIKMKVDLVGEIELTRLPQLVAMAQEFGLNIKIENL